MRVRTVIALLAVLTLTGCAGTDTEDVSSGQEVADMIGCTGWSNTSEEAETPSDGETVTYEDYVHEGGTCQLNGQEVGVYYFLDNMARVGYVEAGTAQGGNYLIGDRWVVEAPSVVLDQLEAEHGGERSFE